MPQPESPVPSSPATTPSETTTNDVSTALNPPRSPPDQNPSSQTNEETDEPPHIDDSNLITQPTALERLSIAVSQILTPKPTTPPDQENPQPPILEAPPQSPTPTQPANLPSNLPPPQDAPPPVDHSTISAEPLPRPRNTTPRHPTFDYPPRVQMFFNDDTDNSEQDPTEIQPPSPDVMTSSTRTDSTCPPIG